MITDLCDRVPEAASARKTSAIVSPPTASAADLQKPAPRDAIAESSASLWTENRQHARQHSSGETNGAGNFGGSDGRF